ncbi:hypothetical protein M2337_002201 [Sphingobium sp. B2D3A]|uniref:hypothetical protein n=1 Tax=unclassified Sphingobium TaxID=2611147 RepID=UPI00222426FE|nr:MULTISPECIES: hypothetical protein [unclassified Sphingobium]MCW2337968.1 hypothetical protein [Sphingobium sp. B2D3A]MCW2384427.1 hypothetical protein [Sphingobium sp. B2D3D]
MSAVTGLSSDLAELLRAFSATETEIVQLGTIAQAARMHELLQLRRQFVEQFGLVSAALQREPILLASPALMTQAMRLLAAFRSRNAINQADWPVIRVRDDPIAYREASQHVKDASRDFWDWIETAVGFRR